MKKPDSTRLSTRLPAFDANAIHDTIQRALAAAGLDTTTGPMHQVSQTIRHALGAAAPTGRAAPAAWVVDVPARVVVAPTGGGHQPAAGGDAPGPAATGADWAPDATRGHQAPKATVADQPPGAVQRHVFSSAAGTRAYRLFVPGRPAPQPAPSQPPLPPALLVMLHGCTQSADDFAAGTQMDALARAHGCLVLYPEQAAQANASACWNWFRPQDQQRGAGEPALIVGMVHEVAARHGVDPRRIFVAGLSAGAAMAVVLGQAYPDVFAGVGAHSGLPACSAHDVPSALAAMKGGRSGLPGLQARPSGPGAPCQRAMQPVPTIVFHGDRDHTVQHSNGAEITRQAVQALRDHHASQAGAGSAGLSSSTEVGTVPGGRSYSRTVLADHQGRVCAESWSVHGAGHAWSGGSALGSYTDAQGPDASAAMLRFFLALQPDTQRAGVHATMAADGPVAISDA